MYWTTLSLYLINNALSLDVILASAYMYIILVSESEVQNMVNVYKKLASLSPRDKYIDRNTL